MATHESHCRYDHHGYCQEHNLGEEIGHGLCAVGMAEVLPDDALLAAFEATYGEEG